MIKKLIKPWPMRWFLNKLSRYAIIALVLILISVILLSYYGNNVGNFVISVEQRTRLSLSLSVNNDFINNATSLLTAVGLKDVTHATYFHIPSDIDQYYGENNDTLYKRYTAYSFYLKNITNIAVDYDMEIIIEQVYKNVDGAIRVLVIINGEREIYAKRNDDGTIAEHLDIELSPYTTTPFVTNSVVCRTTAYGFGSQQVSKYTIVMWLEGNDPDCIDDIKGGSIQMRMNFYAK